jgi:hypothetical protein
MRVLFFLLFSIQLLAQQDRAIISYDDPGEPFEFASFSAEANFEIDWNAGPINTTTRYRAGLVASSFLEDGGIGINYYAKVKTGFKIAQFNGLRLWGYMPYLNWSFQHGKYNTPFCIGIDWMGVDLLGSDRLAIGLDCDIYKHWTFYPQLYVAVNLYNSTE